MSKKTENKIVQVRGNVIDNITGKGKKNVCINLDVLEKKTLTLECKTEEYGSFNFELDNTQSYRLTVKCNGYYDKCHLIPKGMCKVYFTSLIRPRIK